MTDGEYLDKIGSAISTMCKTHGITNRFTVGELSDISGVHVLIIGRILMWYISSLQKISSEKYGHPLKVSREKNIHTYVLVEKVL